ncbi:hypothetical protein AB834_04075 [PVC group bacterium (ex Bugula neritina AB1)]|nr:hypothetical protein AB834_04075 [PVC group bacterium (ex Bugula neritina AB1)]
MIKISQAIVNSLFDQAKDGLPNEVCGFLAGKDGEVFKHYPLTNTDASPEHFSMDPKEQLLAVKDMRSLGLALMACYHSHPSTPARPSDEDIRLAYDPTISYVILSLKDGVQSIKAFKIRDVEVEIQELEIL